MNKGTPQEEYPYERKQRQLAFDRNVFWFRQWWLIRRGLRNV